MFLENMQKGRGRESHFVIKPGKGGKPNANVTKTEEYLLLVSPLTCFENSPTSRNHQKLSAIIRNQ